jgi:hypothetical protein
LSISLGLSVAFQLAKYISSFLPLNLFLRILNLVSFLPISFFFIMTVTRSTANGAGASGSNPSIPNGLSPEMTAMMQFMQGMMQTHQQQMTAQQLQMENQQQQATLLREGLITAQQATTVVLEKVTAPREARTGTAADFKKMNPAMFSGTESPLEAEKWITDVTNLLAIAKIPAEDQVEVVKILFTDVARSWWLAEEDLLTKPIAWEKFTESFFERFFPETAKQDMEQQFTSLKQYDKSVDAYAAEFLRLSRFAPHMVAEEKHRARRFRLGLQWDIQQSIAPLQLNTYSGVLEAARQIENVVVRRNKSRSQNKSGKRPHPQANENTVRADEQKLNPPAKRQLQLPAPPIVCGFCKKNGHYQRDCRLANGQCLICGSGDHQLIDCPRYRPKNNVPALPTPPVRQNPVQGGRGAPLPPQQQRFNQAQRAIGAGRGAGQAGQGARQVYQLAAAPVGMAGN